MADTPTASPVRVMLVDDHPVVRAGYRRLLEHEPGLQVVGEHGDVATALHALDAAPDAAPDVIVVDLAMPELGGLELVREVHARHPATRVLVFSMHDTPAIVAEALRLGAAGFVTKGSAPEQLVRCVGQVGEGRDCVLSSDLAERQMNERQHAEEPLTAKEAAVLRLLAAGQSVPGIARTLGLSPKTVSNYQTMLRHKLGARTAIELLHCARARGHVA